MLVFGTVYSISSKTSQEASLRSYCLIYMQWIMGKLAKVLTVFQSGRTKIRQTILSRWVSVVEFHDRALNIGKVFGQELTVVEWNYQILGLHQVTVHQKLGVILLIKWFRNWSQQKMLFTKKVRLNWYSTMKFFFRKIRMIFDIENSLWKPKIGTFWQTVTRSRLKIW